MKVRIISMTVVLLLGISVMLTYAKHPFAESMEMMNPMEHGMGLKGIPDLTSDQLSKFQKLRLEHQKEMLPLRTKLRSKELELQSLVLESSDQKKIEQKVEELGKIQTELMKKKLSHRLTIRNLLTEEQKAHFDARGFGHQRKHGKGSKRGQCCKGGPGFWKHQGHR